MRNITVASSKQIIDEAVHRLVRTEHFAASTVVNLPILYPSGSTVAVEARLQGDRCFVSDMGNGFNEADLMGSSRYYPKIAQEVAEAAGIRFDGRAVFAGEASIDLIGGLITIVANCSHEAVAQSAFKLARKRDKAEEEQLYHRLVDVFGKPYVERNVEMRGASNHAWAVASLVRIHGHLAVFDSVVAYHSSVVNVATKMHDLARLEDPPARIAVTKDIKKLGDLVGVVSQAANLIEFRSESSTYRKYAAAA